MGEQRVEVNNGFGGLVLGLLGVLFVALKLTGVIAWSWWWVTVPFWVPAALVVVVLLIAGVMALYLTLSN